MSQIDGSKETRGDDGLVSDFIRQIDAQDAELADLKQRLLPQYIGRAERAQRERQMIAHERDSLLEKLRAATTMPCAPSATGEPDRPDWAQQLPGAEIFDRAARYEYIRTLNPRQFAALYDEALADERFDDLVDRYRMKQRPHDAGEKP
jgi:hypothetical protein